MTVTVRSATKRDIDAIQRVARSSWQASHAPLVGTEASLSFFEQEYDKARIRAKITNDAGQFEVAVDDDGVVGFVAAVPLNQSPLLFGLSWLYVHPDRWGEGIGQQLHTTVQQAIERAGGERIRLGVLAENERAIRFYEHAGYTHQDDYYDDRIKARGRLYVKELTR
ncbi:GNAT family N-acetyltransferase [Halocatena pleomorpha]|nr:GNAT family N-acetyltransferase [Halocatena pleomorpha]